ncbi:Sentrin [Trichuris trichiura]|uniref:Sentrin n=1 Tax=Trichuris trichiura TaxID=36087 RepID=A0A077Z231_TRITR|nr:Sentrin [Trichuris trichiura]
MNKLERFEQTHDTTLYFGLQVANFAIELNDDQIEEVIAEWSKQDKPNEVLAKLCSIPVTRADLRTLMGYNWLNDEIVNFYMQLLVSRSKAIPVLPTVYAFSTFFFLKLQRSGHAGVCKWTKDVDIFSYDLLLIPIHLSNHWVLTVAENIRSYPVLKIQVRSALSFRPYVTFLFQKHMPSFRIRVAYEILHEKLL